MSNDPVQAEIVLPCGDLTATLAFFTERLGFRLHTIMPADDPAVAVVSGHGVRLRFDRDATGDAGELRIVIDRTAAGPGDPPTALSPGDELVAPNGTRVSVVAAPRAITDDDLPALDDALAISRPSAEPGPAGRAGMRYRDLIPARHGGRFIASHIVIPDGGPVPDYVHHHRIRFQVIVCAAGWVRVVYEDQGPPFVLAAGDCVLQPPGIRHRVLEASPGAEVVELSCPGEHETHVDHLLTLPNDDHRPQRQWDGQAFVHHRADSHSWAPSRLASFEARDTGVGDATAGLVGVRMLRPDRAGMAAGAAAAPSTEAAVAPPIAHDSDLLFWFVFAGDANLDLDSGRGTERLTMATSVAIPRGMPHRLTDASHDLLLLEITVPASLPARAATAPS